MARIIDELINTLTGTGSSPWIGSTKSEPVVLNDPLAVSVDWLARSAAAAAVRKKGAFETTTEYQRRLAAIERVPHEHPHSLNCCFILDCEAASYDADAATASLTSRPLVLTLQSQLYSRLVLRTEEEWGSAYRLTNKFGASVDGRYITTTAVVFEIVNFRGMVRLRRQIRSGPYTHNEVLGASFPLEVELAREVLDRLALSVRVRLDHVEHDDGYWYGGDDITVPDTHRKKQVILRGVVEGLDVIDTQTLRILGGWNVR